MKSLLIPILAVCALTANAQVIFTAKSAPMKVIQNGQYSNAQRQKVVQITDQGSFERYWSRELGQPPETAPKGLDFISKKLVAIHLGQRPSGGYRLLVQTIDNSRSNISIIRAIEFTPVPGTFVSQAITSPWVLIQVDRDLPNPTASILRREGISTPWNPTVGGGGGGGGNCNCGPNCPCGCGCGG